MVTDPGHELPHDMDPNIVVYKAKPFYIWIDHNRLHSWMEDLHVEKGGQPDDFIMSYLQLTINDLDKLDSDLQSFNHVTEELLDRDRKFIERATHYISEGRHVLYRAWID